jgi:8-oxo-dGTP pyrophosphatase MutT (NUDIX family)
VSGRPAAAPRVVVRAAGGIVCRPGPGGLPEVALVHRPLQDDWSLPKGKLEEGESPEEAALREVEEETGLRCAIVRPAGCTAYVDRRGRDKVVCYWVMRALNGRFQPNDEVDALRWLTVEEALTVLSYPVDRALLSARELCSQGPARRPDVSGAASGRL